MDAKRFDALVRSLAATLSRRGLGRSALAALTAFGFGLPIADESASRSRRKRRRRGRIHNRNHNERFHDVSAQKRKRGGR